MTTCHEGSCGLSTNPAAAYGQSVLALMRERAECIVAGECVHDHINGACPFSEEN